MKVAQKVIKYIKADNEATFGLDEEVRAELTGLKLIEIWEGERHLPICQYTSADGSLTIEPRMEGGLEFVRLTAHPFPASSRLWNGPDLIKNNRYRSMLASLFHDLIWEHADEIAKAWRVSKQTVLQWGDGILYALWMYASETSALGRVEARVAWQVCEFSRGWYHSLKKILGLRCLAFALLLAGCGTPPDWTVSGVEGTNTIYRAMGQKQTAETACGPDEERPGGQQVEGSPTNSPASTPHAGAAAEGETTDLGASKETPAAASKDAVDFASLNWSWGGFNGKNAKLADGCEISSLKVSGNLTYKWVRGGCEKLGATSREDADHTICALFCKLDGKWQGGKFDWISTSRTSRDLKNIEGAYNGWDKNAVSKTSEYAFVIVSADGKKRTNVIKAGR